MTPALSKSQEKWLLKLINGEVENDAVPISVFGALRTYGYAEKIPGRAQPKPGYSAVRLTPQGRTVAEGLKTER